MALPTAAAMLESRVFKNTYGAKYHKLIIITDSPATVYFRFQSSSYQTVIKLEKGFNLFCLCSIISMIHGFWIFFLLFPSNKYVYTVTPDRTTHLVFLMVSDENSELLQMPIGKYCDTPEDQPEGLSIFKHFNCSLKIRALSYDHVQRLDRTCYQNNVILMADSLSPIKFKNVTIEQPFTCVHMRDLFNKKIRQISFIVSQPARLHLFYTNESFRIFQLNVGANVFCDCCDNLQLFSIFCRNEICST